MKLAAQKNCIWRDQDNQFKWMNIYKKINGDNKNKLEEITNFV